MANAAPNLTQFFASLNQNLQELNARLRNGGDDVAGGIVSGFYREAKRFVRSFDENRGLRYRPAVFTISKAITGAGTASSGSESFRVAQNEDFLVTEIRGFVVLNDLPSEPSLVQGASSQLGHENTNGAAAATPNWALSPWDRAFMKAQNCRLVLQNKDTKVPYTENEGVNLASICPDLGGKPLVFGPEDVPGFILPHNTTFEAQFTLQSANLIFNTASTSYGIMVSGLYLSREVR